MRPSSLFSLLFFLIVIIIIIGGIIIIIGPVPPDPGGCIVCGSALVKTLGIAEAVLGAISLGVANRLKNANQFK